MTWPLVLRRRAVREIQAAYDWLEDHAGLGEDFVEEVERVLEVLREHPLRFPVLHGSVRRVLTRRFPYSVLYRLRDEQVVVLSVVHQARDPRGWPR